MSRFLDECAAFVRTLPVGPIRIAEARADGSAETVAFQPANACQNVYSVAKAFAMTAVGLLWDRGLLRLEDCEKVFVLFEVYRHAQAMEVREAIAERMRKA